MSERRVSADEEGVQLLLVRRWRARPSTTEMSLSLLSSSVVTLYNPPLWLSWASSCALFQVSCCLVACQLGSSSSRRSNTRQNASALHHQRRRGRLLSSSALSLSVFEHPQHTHTHTHHYQLSREAAYSIGYITYCIKSLGRGFSLPIRRLRPSLAISQWNCAEEIRVQKWQNVTIVF